LQIWTLYDLPLQTGLYKISHTFAAAISIIIAKSGNVINLAKHRGGKAIHTVRYNTHLAWAGSASENPSRREHG
jgi:hypothetical protein